MCPSFRVRGEESLSWKGRGGDVGEPFFGGLAGLIVGMLGGLTAAYLLGRLRAQTAHNLANQILRSAEREAQAIRMEAELQSREDSLKRKEEFEQELEEARKQIREEEKRMAKRSDLLDQKLELISKKDREFEAIQRYLTEQQEELQKRQQELRQTQTQQRELLQKIGRLTPDEARSMLLSRLEKELRGEIGTLVMRHEAVYGRAVRSEPGKC